MVRTAPEVALLVKRLQHAHHRALSASLADLGISLVQWDTLRHLARHPEASLHELAQLTFQTDQSFGSLAARMVDRGLLQRMPGPGRVVRHRLTELGERLRQEGQGRADRVFAETFAPLDQGELDQLGDLLETLVAARLAVRC
ncbi:MarR family winged helix-turn-helix transcriptional regulator [Couchioplanes caeruleus]|uniref:MarR family winged helix-turn-helix transcriptional regulator n=1 Tax=Couchioplanes caeruleus TaxID=56438 RepID=UPI0020BF12B2|nr:MarR family winged helix-turn-helix transcriptional regulator [Couchioplanes caeruleus]UQU62957.1 MarR family winged helix-turn-helix transcriptional regulator [Couchioplanes caeruleus]